MLLLLPERRRYAGQAISPPNARALGRGDRLADGEPGERAQLQRHFDILPRGWPMAAITREFDAGDAGARGWLRADPAWVQAEANGARLHGWGNLELSAEEGADFLAVLKPVFGDAGMVLDAPVPDRWYLALEAGTPLPAFAEPTAAMGLDLLSALPAGPEGRRWRALFNEAQVLLHQHPRNVERARGGRPPVNALWFWGAGRLPDSVHAQAASLASADPELLALGRLAGLPAATAGAKGALLDLRRQREWDKIERVLLDALRERIVVELDFADGARWRLEAGQRWRLWRRPLAGLESQMPPS
jgi:hypothetical protein